MNTFNNISEILDFAIKSEQEAYDLYMAMSAGSSSEIMKEVFLQFAGEEAAHKTRLLNIKQSGETSLIRENIIDMCIADYVIDVEPKPDMTYQEALIFAMKKEKAAFRLYLNLSEKVSDSSLKNLFLLLAQEESKHKLRFELEYDDVVFLEN